MIPTTRLALTVLLAFAPTLAFADQPGVLKTEFIYEKAPFPECHASTIEETKKGLIVAFFGGTAEKNKDVGIWVSRHLNGKWTAPIEAVNGVREDGQGRYPCWNPVLFQPKTGPLMLFYKVGPSPREWWGMLTTSEDSGATWSKGKKLPRGILGPIKNKPIQLSNGDILSGTSTEHDGWIVHFEKTASLGASWSRTKGVNTKEEFGAIQPTILSYADGRLQALCRSRQQVLTEVWSSDGGKTWSPMTRSQLPNPNAGADGVSLADGRQLLVYNHSIRRGAFPSGREVINVALSHDGRKWFAALVLDQQKGEHSYPAVIQTKDGLVHITYTYLRKTVKHVVLDPSKLELKPIVHGRWPE